MQQRQLIGSGGEGKCNRHDAEDCSAQNQDWPPSEPVAECPGERRAQQCAQMARAHRIPEFGQGLLPVPDDGRQRYRHELGIDPVDDEYRLQQYDELYLCGVPPAARPSGIMQHRRHLRLATR